MPRAFCHAAWDFLRRLYRRFGEHDLFLMAAAIAYYGFVAVIPLLLLGASVAGTVLGDSLRRQEQVEHALSYVFADDVTRTLLSELTQILHSRGVIGGVGLVSLLWIGVRIFDVVERVLNRIWHVKDTRPWWRRKLMSLGIVLLAGLCFALWLSLLSVATVKGYKGLELLGISGTDGALISRMMSAATLGIILVAMFLTIYVLLPYRRVRLGYGAIGAVFATVLWELARNVFFWSVARSHTYSHLYGTLATVFILLVWIYLSSFILLVGAEVSSICQQFASKDQRATVERAETPGV